jgi:probable HAF family extracellular repeat protein
MTNLNNLVPPGSGWVLKAASEINEIGQIVGWGSAPNGESHGFLLTPLCFADLDGDADVDLSDLAQVLANYGTTSGADYEDGDLDGDGDVDLADLSALLAVYGTTCD